MKLKHFMVVLLLILMMGLLPGCGEPAAPEQSAVLDFTDTGTPPDTGTPVTAPEEEEPALTPVMAVPKGADKPADPSATPKAPAAPAKTTPNQTENTDMIPAAETDASDAPYYLYVEKGSYTLTIYERDDEGGYSKVYKTYRLSHGGNKTPAGTFTLGKKERWHEFPDGGFVQYATRYHNRLYIHSPLYGEESNGRLWPRYYDGDHGIGGSNTGGCLRMVTEAARFIYENCPENTVIEIVNGAPKGTVSDDVPSRNGKRTDPTDVDAN